MPVMVTLLLLPLCAVITVNEAVADPSGTTTTAGTRTSDALEVLSETDAPPAGAADESVIVPLALVPPTTAVGVTMTEASAAAAGMTVTLVEAEEGPALAVIVAVVAAAGEEVVMLNAALDARGGIVTLDGSGTAALEEARLTTVVSVRGPIRNTNVITPPPLTVAGEAVMAVMLGTVNESAEIV